LLLAFLPASAVVGQGERPGVILGKAPEGLDAGTGTILALVRLQ
jgi:hypothetical protein